MHLIYFLFSKKKHLEAKTLSTPDCITRQSMKPFNIFIGIDHVAGSVIICLPLDSGARPRRQDESRDCREIVEDEQV